jgi:hypothetical protein
VARFQSFFGAPNNQERNISFAAQRGVPQQLSNRYKVSPFLITSTQYGRLLLVAEYGVGKLVFNNACKNGTASLMGNFESSPP